LESSGSAGWYGQASSRHEMRREAEPQATAARTRQVRHRGGPRVGFSFEGDREAASSIVTAAPVRPESARVPSLLGGTSGDHTQDLARAEALDDRQDNQR
jgi:hypothetical protein